MSVIYKSTEDSATATRKAFKLTDVQNAVGDDTKPKLQWWLYAPDIGYLPYVVRISSLSDTQIEFRFIDCTTGKELGNLHKIDRKDRTLVWDADPTTLTGFAAGSTDCAFLFLADAAKNSADLGADMKAADTSGGGQGKWPHGADLFMKYMAVKGALDQLRGLIGKIQAQNPSAISDLKTAERAKLEAIMEGLY